MNLNVTVQGIDEVREQFKHLLPSQIRFSALVATDRMAEQTQSRMYAEMHRVFDRPTPYTMNALKIKRPSMQDMTAEVGFKESWAARSTRYLNPQVEGGTRPPKIFEMFIQERATTFNLRGGYGVYPRGTTFAPARGARINAYGNMSSGQIQQILAGLGAMTDVYSNTTKRSKARKKRTGHYVATPRAIWFVDKGKMTPLLFVMKSRPLYRKRYDFYTVAQNFVREHFPRLFDEVLRERTVRGPTP